MSTEIRNWDVVAKAMEAAGATSSQMYVRAKALALGKLDPMPTSSPEAPYSISAVAGWSQLIKASTIWGSITQSMTWLIHLKLDLASAISLRLGTAA